MHRVGVLLINLGTPETASLSGVRSYLRTFLGDKRVINLPFFLRFLLVNGLIVPFRAKRSLKAYKKVWNSDGSPLRTHSVELANKLQEKLAGNAKVVLGMRYGTPSLLDALESLKHCEKLVLLPLYPQYASSTTGSSIEYSINHLKKRTTIPSFTVIREFYQHPSFIKTFASRIQKALTNNRKAHLLLSYHGLPEKQVIDSGCKTICQGACSNNALKIVPGCYRGQCFKTSELIVKALSLSQDSATTSFQSRLGRLPWIKPYTDNTLENLRKKEIEDIVVACPSFSADCLETLEEIAIEGKKLWLSLGGKTFSFVPSLNSDEDWVDTLATLVKDNTPKTM